MKLTLSAAALAMSMAFVPFSASALDYSCCDRNKDGMISKQEFLDEMGKRYDMAMAEIKKMPAADQAKMMKGTQLTTDGFAMVLKMLEGKQ
ncbi:MAG: hypothetical protein OEV65_11370 [Aquincola sp.]|nr:hypothetical protein [Aquincola sp.]